MKLADPSLLKSQCLVDGKWVGEGTRPIANPATGAVLAKTPRFGEAETIGAIEAAQRAFGPWAKTLPKERAQILRRWFDLIIANRDDIALIMTSEQGKPLAEARGEVDYAAAYIEFFGEEAKRIYGEINPTFRADSRIVVIKQPIGVVAAITPWNFPAAMITRKVAPAIAVGCTVVAKPAGETPLTALALGELALRAGLPPGVLNFVTGEARAIGKAMTEHPAVRVVGFTGSTEVGKVLMAQAAGTVKKVGLELGGNAPFIVFDDAACRRRRRGRDHLEVPQHGPDLRLRQPHLRAGGHLRRLRRQAHDRGLASSRSATGRRPASCRGRSSTRRRSTKVEEHVADAVKKGAKVVVGGKRHALGRTFYEPTVISGVDSSMLVAREEEPSVRSRRSSASRTKPTSSPTPTTRNSASRPTSTPATSAGCGASPRRSNSGMVGINTGAISSELAPFGGVKESGIGREGSRHGVEEFVELKYMLMGGLDR